MGQWGEGVDRETQYNYHINYELLPTKTHKESLMINNKY